MTPEKIDNQISVWSKRFGLILLGWFASSAYHGVYTLDQKAATLQHVQQVDLPKLKAQAAQVPALKAKVGCEHWRAGVIENVAKQGIASANSDAVPVPSAKAIPPDNCQPIITKK